MKGYIILLCLVVFFACKQTSEPKNEDIFKGVRKEYSSFEKLLPDSILVDFPRSSSKDVKFMDVTTPHAVEYGLNYCGVFIEKYDKGSYPEELESLTRKCDTVIALNDQCILLIPRRNGNVDLGDRLFECDKIFPIPSVKERLQEDLKTLVDDEIEICILDFGYQNVLSYKFESSNSFPGKYKTGYSKGAFINRKDERIVYYLICW